MRLDALDQHAAEDVRPGVVRGDADAGRAARCGERVAIGLAAAGERRQQVDAGVALERLARRSAARARRTDRRSRPRKRSSGAPAASAATASSAAQSCHHRLVGLIGAIPFEHGELGVMQRRRARGCGRRGRNRRCAARRRRAASCRRIPARCADRAAARSPPGAISSVAKACRCASLPGETCSAAVSTSTKPLRLEPARAAPP